VRDWWSSWPNANIACATGRIVVVDIDFKNGGTLAAFEALGPLPPTWRTATGNGAHLFFRAGDADIRNSVGRIAPGVDIRGHGGYVVLPPSLHISGKRYRWEVNPSQAPLAKLPGWIVAVINKAKPATAPANWLSVATTDVVEGRRNDTIARLAGHLLRHHIDPDVTLELLLAFNNVRCCPPLSLDEVTQTVNSIAGAELRRRGAEAAA
jgi:hypothetical protein